MPLVVAAVIATTTFNANAYKAPTLKETYDSYKATGVPKPWFLDTSNGSATVNTASIKKHGKHIGLHVETYGQDSMIGVSAAGANVIFNCENLDSSFDYLVLTAELYNRMLGGDSGLIYASNAIPDQDAMPMSAPRDSLANDVRREACAI